MICLITPQNQSDFRAWKKKGQDEEKGKEERADWWECGGKEELDGEDERAVHERRKEEVGCFRIGLCTYTQ